MCRIGYESNCISFFVNNSQCIFLKCPLSFKRVKLESCIGYCQEQFISIQYIPTTSVLLLQVLPHSSSKDVAQGAVQLCLVSQLYVLLAYSQGHYVFGIDPQIQCTVISRVLGIDAVQYWICICCQCRVINMQFPRLRGLVLLMDCNAYWFVQMVLCITNWCICEVQRLFQLVIIYLNVDVRMQDIVVL